MSTPRIFGSTQEDIARALNISRASVAIALNPKTRHKLPPATTSRIEVKARELNYRPQRQARILRSGRSHTIGVVCRAGSYHAPQERVQHLVRGAIRAGYQLISIDMEWFEDNLATARDYLLDVAVEGIIFCNISSDGQEGWIEFARKRSLPVLSMSSSFDTVDQTRSDMRTAFRDLTLHHLAQGSRRPHFLLPFHDNIPVENLYNPFIIDRVGGFVDAVISAGGEVAAAPETAQIFDLPTKFSPKCPAIRARVHYPVRTELYKDVMDVGYHEAQRLLQAEKADSLVCSNDHIAAGAITACIEQGIRIPDEVRISGADNSPFARYCGMPLTTIEQPSQGLAEWSIRRIVELIENPEARKSPEMKLFPCKLIIRKSTQTTA